MKKILAVCFLIWAFNPAIAQKDSSVSYKLLPKAFISVNVGIGFPTNGFYIQYLGPYSGQYDGSYGYTGYTINTLGAFPVFHSHFSLAGLISINSEPFNISKRFQDLYED